MMQRKRRLRPLVMPTGMKELIRFALEPLKLQPPFDAEDVLAYRTGYANGLTLTSIIFFVSEPHLLILKRPAISISVVDADRAMTSIRCEYMTKSLRAPSGPHDMEFAIEMMSRFIAGARAVADELEAGARVY